MAVSILQHQHQQQQQQPVHSQHQHHHHRRDSLPPIADHLHRQQPHPSHAPPLHHLRHGPSHALLLGRDFSSTSSRPSSTSTAESPFLPPPANLSSRHDSVQLPGLAVLAQAAERNSYCSPIPTPPPPPPAAARPPPMYAGTAPQSMLSNQAAPPICQNCQTSTTPLWRRDDSGSVLCNACGLFLKLHNKPRPISLKTDVIKSRNRVKAGSAISLAAQQAQQHHAAQAAAAAPSQRRRPSSGTALAAAHPDIASNPQSAERRPPIPSETSQTAPVSRSATPSVGLPAVEPYVQPPQIPHHQPQPQHQSQPPQYYARNMSDYRRSESPRDTRHVPMTRPPSRSPTEGPSAASTSEESGSAVASLIRANEALRGDNESLRTRVSELEVINDLFRGRVAELERSEADTRSRCMRLEDDLRELRALVAPSQTGQKRERDGGDEERKSINGTVSGTDEGSRGSKRARASGTSPKR